MDYNALRQGIREEAGKGTMEILSESETDILVFDYNDSKEINFHMIPPTKEWLASRIVWGPSLTRSDTHVWTAYLADYLHRIDPAMFICLNRVIIIDDSEDRKAVANLLGVDEDNLPEENEDLIGQLWFQENCVFVYVSALREETKEIVKGDLAFFDYDQEMEIGFKTTLIHETRHLGLNCNIFLPESEYPISLQSEEAVENWAREMFEKN